MKKGLNVIVGSNCSIADTVVIMDDVIIEDDVTIHDYVVIFSNTVIRKGVEIFPHCVLAKLPKAPGCNSRSIHTDLGPTVIGNECILSPGCGVYRGVEISNNTLLGDYCSIREDCKVGSYCILSRNVSVNYNTEIGDRTKIMDNSHITGDMRIGNGVFISVLVSTTNDNTMDREEDSASQLGGPVIEDNASIGAGANILPHVRIGYNSMVGAGALVTKDVPKGKLVMGVPAKIIRDVEER